MPFLVQREMANPTWRPFDLWEAMEHELHGVDSDVYETDNDLTLKLAIPGFSAEQVAIEYTGDTITVSGEQKKEENVEKRSYHRKEIETRQFEQSITLPTEVEAEKAEATFTDGILTIVLPKAEAIKPKQIQIKTS